MATFHIVPEQDMQVLQRYLPLTGSAVLITESTVKQVDNPGQIRELDSRGEISTYDFGGEPDVFVDIITHPDHYGLQQLRQN